MMQQLLQFALSDKLVQMVSQTPAILCCMAMIPMILAVEVSVSLFRISHHLIGPFEEGLVLDFFQYLMHWFSEYNLDHLIVICPWLLCIIPSRSVIVVSVRPKISSFLRDNLSFPFSLLLIVFYPFILVNSIH